MENIICNQYGKKLAILNTENIKICGSITKPEAQGSNDTGIGVLGIGQYLPVLGGIGIGPILELS